MPIFRISGKLIFYAHIPKAGGSSVADYFAILGARTAFVFGEHWRQRPRDRWSSTSPQHIDAKSLAELFPRDFFDACFTVVRHPEDRLISEYKFRTRRSKIHAALSLTDWLHVVTAASRANPFAFDGHLRPQIDFVPPDCKVFKLETGLQDLSEWVSEVTGTEPSLLQFTQHSNKSAPMNIGIFDRDRKLINHLYDKDFAFFGYEARATNGLPKAPLLARAKANFLQRLSAVSTNILSQRIPY